MSIEKTKTKREEPVELLLKIREDSVFEQTITQRYLEMIARLNSEQIDRMLSYNASKGNPPTSRETIPSRSRSLTAEKTS